uniref:Uncharacterized protein n=1 Tax=Glossina brevipalpis TaxID=37001 RepID=A0A1A9W2Z6_9MUSC
MIPGNDVNLLLNSAIKISLWTKEKVSRVKLNFCLISFNTIWCSTLLLLFLDYCNPVVVYANGSIIIICTTGLRENITYRKFLKFSCTPQNVMTIAYVLKIRELSNL